MATTEHFYAGTGSNTSFPFEFPYLTESDVFVELYNSSTGNFDLLQQNTSGQNNDYSISNTNIVFNVAPPNIANVNNIHIYRNTDVETAKAVYGTGSAIRAQDLNDNTNQSLYKLQEGAQLITTGDIKDEAIDSSKIKDGTIVNTDISSTAEIAVSKLANGSARQLLQTDAAGTGVEWASNIDVPGTLDVTGNTDIDANLNVDGTATLATVDINSGAIDGTTIGASAPSLGTFTTLTATTLDVNGSGTVDNIQLNGNEIDTTSGNLTLDSAGGTTTVDDNLNVTGNLDVTGSITGGSINATTLANLGVGSFLRADANDESTAGTYTLRGPSTGSSANRAKIQGRDLELVFGLGNNDQAQTMKISSQRHGVSDGQGNAASINDLNLGAGNLGLPAGSTELNSTQIGHVSRISLGRAYMTVAKANNVFSTNELVMRASYPDGLMFYHPDTTVTGAGYTSTSGGNTYEQNITDARNAADMRIITGGILAKNKVEIGSSSVAGTLQISGTDVTSTAAEINTLDGVTSNTSELNKLDGFTGSTADLNEVVTGKNVVETITGSATDTQLPTAQAVNERIVELVTEVGGFHPITNETSFPTTNPDINDGAGTIVSLKSLTSAFSTGSGVTTHTFTNGAGSGNNVIINGLPASTTFPAGRGLLLETTSTLHTYNYHRLTLDEAGVANAQAVVDDFDERYYGPFAADQSTRPSGANRVNGDLYFNTSDGKMKVWNGSHASGTWDDVAAPGNFFINTLSSSSGSGGGSATFNGTATRFTLSNPPLTAQQLLVSVNGVIQKPNSGTSPSEGFAIDSADIIFASAPATSAPYFIVTIGSSVNIGTPSNDTVGAAQIIDGSISNAEISSSAAIAKSKLAALDIVNADVNASAAIAGTKVSPDFGTQNIVTTGTITTGTVVGSGDLLLRPAAGNNSIIMQSNNGSETLFKATVNGSVELYHGTSTSEKKFETTSLGTQTFGDAQFEGNDGTANQLFWDKSLDTLYFRDNVKANFGTSGDLSIYHNGIDSYIDNITGAVLIRTNATETSAKFFANAQVELYHDSYKKFETTSAGAKISGTGATFLEINSTDGSVNPMVRMTNGDRTWDAGLRGDTSDSYVIRDHTASANRLTIDSAGKVGIGITSPSVLLDCQSSTGGGAQHTIRCKATDSNASTFIKSESSDNKYIGFLKYGTGHSAYGALGAGGAAVYTGSGVPITIMSDGASGYINFATGGSTERMRIDESGHLRFSGTTEEIKLNTSDGSDNGFLNLSGGGECSQLRGSQVVMYGNESSGQEGQLLLMAGNSSNTNGVVRFYTGGSERARIQSGGGISFNGDTTAANALNDYEEGSYTPTMYGQSGTTAFSLHSGEQSLSYQKVGNTVTIHGRIRINSNNFSGAAYMTLPFAAAANSNTDNAGSSCVATHGVDFDSTAGTGSHMGLFVETGGNSSYAWFLISRDNANWISATSSHIQSDSYLSFTHTYRAS